MLESVSLSVDAGETLAILGPAGAGKTTLVALLLGLYRPWSGRILVDGEPLEQIDIRQLRRQAGALLQEGAAMRGTVAANIAFGRPEVPRQEVERAAELAATRASSSASFRMAMRPRSATTACVSRPASASGSRWPGRCSARRRC